MLDVTTVGDRWPCGNFRNKRPFTACPYHGFHFGGMALWLTNIPNRDMTFSLELLLLSTQRGNTNRMLIIVVGHEVALRAANSAFFMLAHPRICLAGLTDPQHVGELSHHRSSFL